MDLALGRLALEEVRTSRSASRLGFPATLACPFREACRCYLDCLCAHRLCVPGQGDGEGYYAAGTADKEDHSDASLDECAIPEDVCCICLDSISPTDLAIIKGCEHIYCGETSI